MSAAAKLIEFLGSEFDKRLPPVLSEEEREERIAELLAEDTRLNELATRLARMLRGESDA